MMRLEKVDVNDRILGNGMVTVFILIISQMFSILSDSVRR